jgi:hypothetical protein
VTGLARPPADPDLVADLRCHLDHGIGACDPPTTGDGSVLVVTKDRLTRSLACPEHATSERSGGREFSLALACGALVGALFRQLVTTGTIDEPMVDGMDALGVDEHQAPLVDWIEQRSPSECSELRAEVDRQVDGLRRRWPVLDPAWLPRTQECLRVPLAGGRVELVTRVDLAVGRPGGDTSSVALVDVTSGTRRSAHRDDRHFHALAETLRGSAPPFAVATYYTRTGELDVDPVTTELLVGAARRCRAGIEVLSGPDALGSTTVPAAMGHLWCAACAEAPLGSARPSVAAADGSATLVRTALASEAPPSVPSAPTVRVVGTDGPLPFPAERAA